MVRDRPKRRRRGAAGASEAPFRGAEVPIQETILHLRQIRSAVTVAVAALRRQNCELDEDIATLLQRCVCDPLHDRLERLEAAAAGSRAGRGR